MTNRLGPRATHPPTSELLMEDIVSLANKLPVAAEAPAPNDGVSLRGVTKTFPGVRALSEVDFDCVPGEVHALVGENGSGKSTLIKIASGVLAPDTGTVAIGGQLLTGASVKRSRALGLATAYQDTSLVQDLTVSDNVSLS